MNYTDSDFNQPQIISMPPPAIPASATEMNVSTSPRHSNLVGHGVAVGGNMQAMASGVPLKIEEVMEPK